MSQISMDIPTVQIHENELQNLINFIYKHEYLLKEFGALKIQPNIGCKLALKKRPKNIALRPIMKEIVKMNTDEAVYLTQEFDHIEKLSQERSPIVDERSFWSSLPGYSNTRRQLNTSILPKKSFFAQKTSRSYFDIHRLPNQSLLKLGGNTVTRQIVPYIRRAHGSGAIFPMTSAQQQLFSIDYHHEGGIHHWYIIPTREREALQRVINYPNSSICLDHGQLFIDPLMLDKNHIRYHRIVQHPNEFVVLSAGTLAQSFTEDASWSESIVFALPSWIEEGHASVSLPPCQCNMSQDFLSQTIDVSLFSHEHIRRYITVHLSTINDNKSPTLKGS